MKFEAEGDLKLQLDLFLNEGLTLHDNFEKPVELGIETAFNRVEYTWPDANPSGQGVFVNDGDGALSWFERVASTLDVLDALVALGVMPADAAMGHYGEIHAHNVMDELTISGTGQANRVLVDSFITNGESHGVTPDKDNSQLIINDDGVYSVTCYLAVESVAGSAATFGFTAYKNINEELEHVHAHRDLAAGGSDIGSLTMGAIVRFVVGDTIRIYVWNEDNTNNIKIDDITLTAFRVGG